MSLEQIIMADLKEAMKNKNQAALRGIRAIKAGILLLKTEPGFSSLDEAAEIKLLQKLVKQRQESLDIYTKQNRPDLAKPEMEEIEVIQKYLPKQLGEEEIVPMLHQIIKDLGAEGMKDMGKVMSAASQLLAGKVDGKSLSTAIKKLLSH